jgi:hypothetical protein
MPSRVGLERHQGISGSPTPAKKSAGKTGSLAAVTQIPKSLARDSRTYSAAFRYTDSVVRLNEIGGSVVRLSHATAPLLGAPGAVNS